MLERDYIQPPEPKQLEDWDMETEAEITFDDVEYKAMIYYYLRYGQCYLYNAFIGGISISLNLTKKEKYNIEYKLDRMREQKLEYYRNF